MVRTAQRAAHHSTAQRAHLVHKLGAQVEGQASELDFHEVNDLGAVPAGGKTGQGRADVRGCARVLHIKSSAQQPGSKAAECCPKQALT